VSTRGDYAERKIVQKVKWPIVPKPMPSCDSKPLPRCMLALVACDTVHCDATIFNLCMSVVWSLCFTVLCFILLLDYLSLCCVLHYSRAPVPYLIGAHRSLLTVSWIHIVYNVFHLTAFKVYIFSSNKYLCIVAATFLVKNLLDKPSVWLICQFLDF